MYGHVMRNKEEEPVKIVWRESVWGRRSEGRQIFRRSDGVKRDMRELGSTDRGG